MPDPVVNLPGEKWRPIPDWEGYYDVSNFGRVKSLARIVVQRGRWSDKPYSRRVRERILKPGRDGHGYLIVGLWRSGGPGARAGVHRLVLEAFVGPRPEGMEACHNDGNRLNNKLPNLRWDTRKNNLADRVKHGTSNRGERHGMVKLTKADVLAIRANPEGLSRRALGERHSVREDHITKIVNRKCWTHI